MMEIETHSSWTANSIKKAVLQGHACLQDN